MSAKVILQEVEELLLISKRWNERGEIPAIERELALERIKRLYEQILFLNPTPASYIEDDSSTTEASDEANSEVDETQDTPMFIPAGFDIESVKIELEVTTDDLSDIEVEDEDDEVVDEIVDEEIEIAEETDEIEEPEEEPQTIIMEVLEYDHDDETEESEEEEEEEEEDSEIETETEAEADDETEAETPKTENINAPQEIIEISLFDQPAQPQTISEIMSANVQPTIADIMAQSESSTVANLKVSEQDYDDLLSQVSLGDRYLIAEDLFGGDNQASIAMLTTLSQIDNFDDCMIHIVENYDWDPEHPTTRVVLELLERKFLLD